MNLSVNSHTFSFHSFSVSQQCAQIEVQKSKPCEFTDRFMKRRKYSFTLMEVMVGFAIISLVLGMTFSSLYQETLLKTKIETMEKTVMAHVETQQFLDRVFANLISNDLQETKRTLYSLKDPRPKLYVTFDNGINPNSNFCEKIDGVLSVENEAFVFKLREGETSERTIILRENVNTVSFEFLTNGTTGMESFSTWDDTHNFSPSYIKITLNKDEDYVFWVNQSNEGIPLKGSPLKGGQ